jgi:DNA-binding transcriptional LysR family regulator
MSQPAMTKALARIEERCGILLFARNRHGIELTKTGRLIFDEVQLRVRDLDRLNETIETIRSGRRGHIRLASIPVLAENGIGTLIGEYLCDNRDIRIELSLERSDLIP